MTQDDRERDKKERVLHTRVPAVLEQELKRLATSLKVPVSNVVRTILEDAVDAVDSVGRAAEGELRDVADRLRERRGRLRKGSEEVEAADEARAPLAGIVGYQPLFLARDEVCSLCGGGLRLGEKAYLGIRDGVGPRVILGWECLPFSAARKETDDDEKW